MLDAFIIEEIRRRERLDERVQPQLERPDSFPFPFPPDAGDPAQRDRRGYDDDDHEHDNGVIILDM